MSLSGRTAEVYSALVHAGGEARLYQLTEKVGTSASYVSRCLTQLVACGMVDRVGEGRYRASEYVGSMKTLSTELGIPHKKTVTPVAPQAELRKAPAQRHPASILLEVIAHAPNPREYAGVVQEIGKVLA